MILIDTNVLIALAEPRDPLHSAVMKDLARLHRQPLYTISPVLTETGYFLEHPIQRARLRSVMEALRIERYSGIEEEQIWQEVFGWILKYGDQSPDMTDAFLVILSSWEPKLKIWTYDSEFKTIWRRPDGSRVPLALRL